MSWFAVSQIRLDGVLQLRRRRPACRSVADSASSSSIDAGSYFFSVKPSPVGQRPHFVGADAVDETVEMLADPRLGPAAVGRLQQDVDGAVEFLFRRLDVPLLELRLAGLEVAFGRGDQRQDRIFDRLRRPGGCGAAWATRAAAGAGVTTTALRSSAGSARGNERDQREWKQALPLKSEHSGRSAIAIGRHVRRRSHRKSPPQRGLRCSFTREGWGPPHLWPSQSSNGRSDGQQ